MTSLSETGGRSAGRTVTAVILAIIAILCLIAGILYVAEPASSLPGFLSAGSSLKGSTGHHTVRAIGSFVLAAIFLVATVFAVRSGRAAAQPGEGSPAGQR
jgi:amino acid permease